MTAASAATAPPMEWPTSSRRNGSLTEPLKGRVQAGVDAFLQLGYCQCAGLCACMPRRSHILTAPEPPSEPPARHRPSCLRSGFMCCRRCSVTKACRRALDEPLQGRARHLIFSGAHPGGVVTRHTEANVMREYAEGLSGQRAIAPGSWLEEDASTSTYENALFSLELVRQQRWTSVLLVTSPFHQIRSQLVFQKLAAAAAAAHAGSEGWWQPTKVYVARTAFVPHAGHFWWPLDRLVDWWDFVREVAALVYYLGRARL
ncbi:hypothetical protein TSOC_002081, partial [Tetrabaena socialis]